MEQEISTQYAGFWRRFLAYVLDNMAIGLITSVVAGISGLDVATLRYGELNFHNLPDVALGIQIAFAITWLYYAFSESSSYRASIGKYALGLAVTKEDGSQLTFKDATIRFFSKILSSLTLGIGYLMIAWTKKKQGLHDKIAHTIVVRQ